ncbi:hypothetical protein NDU88_002532 [Pleurodeles waltl]|uniref:Uncharacterized protein n=1 Tax=Pleurodeles waltl TaxID=8319 RepID=A0AAV7PB57_PLEWA|nr:hypothetical protein NDU88_002532 [Pleurodeles waltl]
MFNGASRHPEEVARPYGTDHHLRPAPDLLGSSNISALHPTEGPRVLELGEWTVGVGSGPQRVLMTVVDSIIKLQLDFTLDLWKEVFFFVYCHLIATFWYQKWGTFELDPPTRKPDANTSR